MVTKSGTWIAVALGTALFLFATLDVHAEDGKDVDVVDWRAKAEAVWQKNCQKCHTVPDPQFETDRGFLAQIMETT